MKITRRQLRRLIEAYIAGEDPRETRSARRELDRVISQEPWVGPLATSGPVGVAQASDLYGSIADDPMGELALDLEERYPGVATDPDYGDEWTGIDDALHRLDQQEKEDSLIARDIVGRLPDLRARRAAGLPTAPPELFAEVEPLKQRGKRRRIERDVLKRHK